MTMAAGGLPLPSSRGPSNLSLIGSAILGRQTADTSTNSKVASESVLSREGLAASGASVIALALVDRRFMALEVMLAGEALAADSD